ncbi:MAG: DUF4177 domain-containing protein [Deltaproteobacteria bacterium]
MEYPAYKVVEVSQVTDEELERVINKWVGEGWLLDGIHFAMRESSKRPSMAFVVFTCFSGPRNPDKAT